MFGEISVTEDGGVKALRINNQVQGSWFTEPDASEFDKRTKGPLIAASAYPYGWLIAGTQNPSGSFLMCGLGSGCGIAILLANFPECDVTCVEIDEAIASTALKAFPILEHFINAGRLNLVIQDAKTFLQETSSVFDASFSDAYTGRSHRHINSFHHLLKHRSKEVYFNIIDNTENKLIQETSQTFKDLGAPIKWLMRALPPELMNKPYVHTSNWIATTADLNWKDVDAFEPWKDFDVPQATWGRICYNGIIANPKGLD
jgi:hypothetical protein